LLSIILHNQSEVFEILKRKISPHGFVGNMTADTIKYDIGHIGTISLF
jgi:hypothetical protein